MKYYSTNKNAETATLHEAVVKGLAPDKGLYMPEIINKLPIEYSSVLELKMNGFNYREISTLLDIPSSTVEYRIRRIRKEINQYYCQEAI